MIWSFKKDALKNVVFDFMFLVFKWRRASYIPIQFVTTGNPVNSCFASTTDKTHNGLVIAPFSVQLLQFLLIGRRCPSNQPFLLLLMIYYGYAATHMEHLWKTLLICSDLLNCLKSGGTKVKTTESG